MKILKFNCRINYFLLISKNIRKVNFLLQQKLRGIRSSDNGAGLFLFNSKNIYSPFIPGEQVLPIISI